MGKQGPTWSELPGDDLLKFAHAIKPPTDKVETQKIERLSLPSPWARLLLFEHAILYGDFHPARDQVVGEWRGLLGLIGLSQLLGASRAKSKLTTSIVSLAHSDLSRMRPGGWPAGVPDEITLIYWDEKLVGGSSPMTMIFTGRRRVDPLVVIPFVVDGRFTDPLKHYARLFGGASDEMARNSVRVLSAWVHRTWESVRDSDSLDAALGTLSGVGGLLTRRSRLQEELYRWSRECEEVLGGAEAAAESAAELSFDEKLDLLRHPFDFLRPVHWNEQERPHPLGLAHAPKLVVDPAGGRLLDRNGNLVNGSLAIRGALALEVRDGVVATRVDRTLGENERRLGVTELFEPRLIRLDAADNEVDARFTRLLIAGSGRYFLPIKPELAAVGLDEAVLSAVSAEERKDRGAIVVRIDLRVQGGRTVRFEKEYAKSSAIEEVVPSDLWVWPDFESDSWRSYFWANAIPQTSTLNVARFTPVVPSEPKPPEFRPNGADGTRWGLADRPLRFWAVSASQSEARGLLLMQPPNEGDRVSDNLVGKPWKVAIDFGSTHTLAYVRPGDASTPEELPIRDRSVCVIGSGKDIEYNFFTFRAEKGAPIGAPTLLWAPVDTLVDPNNDTKHQRWLPGHGQIFYGTEVKGKKWSSLFANLKWRPLNEGKEKEQAQIAFKNYLSHFALMIAAEAAAHGASIEKVYGSYPGIFDRTRVKDFRATLNMALRAVNPSDVEDAETGETDDIGDYGERQSAPAQRIEVELPCDEATALESYLRSAKRAVAKNGLFAVDIGGSTSDFVVLRAGDSARRYSSIQFAGGVVNRIIGADERTAAAVRTALKSDHIGLKDREADRIMRLLSSPENRSVGAGLLIRTLAADTTAMPKFATALFSAGIDGKRILAAVAYLFATNAFFMGLLAGPMEKGRQERGGYLLYFAGRGSLFRDWINALREERPGSTSSGVVEELVAHFFLAGVNVEGLVRGEPSVSCGVKSIFPAAGEAKREVAIGLLDLPEDLKDLAKYSDRMHANPIGELGFSNRDGGEFSWNEPLTADVLSAIDPPGLEFSLEGMRIFSTFVAAFSTLNLRIQGLDFARLLQVSPKALQDMQLTDLVDSRLFGEGSPWKHLRDHPNEGDPATFEPMFVSSAKALLEYGFGGVRLF